jgi:diguanylate cyclase (GGDEF)-like protein/PAS domain S-box-containing protein
MFKGLLWQAKPAITTHPQIKLDKVVAGGGLVNVDEFLLQVEAFFDQLTELNQQSTSFSFQQVTELMIEICQAFQTTLEELRVAEEELHQQNEELAISQLLVEAERQRYHHLFEFAPNGYLVTDVAGVISEANRVAAVLLGVEQQYLVGKPLANFIARESRPAFRHQLNCLQQIDRVQEWPVHLQPRHQAEPLDAVLTIHTVCEPESKVLTVRWLLRDVTEFKRAQEALLRAEIAEAAQRELEKEIAHRQRAEQELLHNAFHDALTELPNRALFMNRLQHAANYEKRHEHYQFAVLFLDLDGFKLINDSLGHLVGDQLLLLIAQRLISCLRPTDTVARLGGDEFTILLEDIQHINETLQVVDRIQATLKMPFAIGEQEVFITASIGIALSTTGYHQPEELLRNADIAMYQAKVQGKAQSRVFNIAMHTQAMTRLQQETELHQAIERQEFRIHYQPIVSLATGRISGFEALIRWQHPQRGLLWPEEFFSIAEETGLIAAISQGVLREACRQFFIWQQQHSLQPDVTLSVNLSNQQFTQPHLVEQVDQILQETGLAAHHLTLEITEGMLMDRGESVATILSQLKTLGIQLSIDDFGTGYSSLGRLACFPINLLKIDRSFISKMSIDQKSSEIVETIVTLAHKLSIAVVAEGVETVEQLAQLQRLGCEHGQGYFFSQPLESEVLINCYL